MKTVSVIIPFYSHVDWLCEAIDSVLAQTYPIHEIILIDDGSKEDLTEILAKYGDKIQYVRQENAGPAAARNNGIRRATGDYIAFEDSDDIWLPTKIEKQVTFMEEIDAVWSHTGFYYWWPKTNKLKRVNVSRDYGDVYLQRHVSTKIATPAIMINKKIYNIGNFYFPEEVRNGEDDQLYTELSKYYPLGLVEEPLLKVRMRGSNSQTRVMERFILRAINYKKWKKAEEKLPPMIHLIYSFYIVYSKIFGNKSGRIVIFFAKCCWVIPFILERIYIRYLYSHTIKDGRYIIR